ncbi:MAG TPA: methyltransferase domain-containing protein [Micromonosporaceae bacterium]
MLDAVCSVLRCPLDAGTLTVAAAALECGSGHTFDVARQGYVNLLAGRAPAGADTPAMVAARAELFDAGHLAPLTAAIVAELPDTLRLALDVGAGTGHHLAAVVDARPGSIGIALDISKAAARRSARAHPAVGAMVADVWRRLPLADGCADVVLDVFAPRHGSEFRRVLEPTGRLIVVTPTAEHLAELVGPLGLLAVDPEKADRVRDSLGGSFEAVRRRRCRYRLALTRAHAAGFVAMGPSAWHTTPETLAGRLADWAEPVAVTVSVEVCVYRPRP